MFINEMRLRRVLGQVADEGACFGDWPADDGANVRRQIDRLPATDGMCPRQHLAHRSHRGAFGVGQIVETQQLARIDQRVFADQIANFGFCRIIQSVVRCTHVGEFGRTAVFNHNAAGE